MPATAFAINLQLGNGTLNYVTASFYTNVNAPNAYRVRFFWFTDYGRLGYATFYLNDNSSFTYYNGTNSIGSLYDVELGSWMRQFWGTPFCVIDAINNKGYCNEIDKGNYVVVCINYNFGSFYYTVYSTAYINKIDLIPFELNGYSTMATIFFSTNSNDRAFTHFNYATAIRSIFPIQVESYNNIIASENTINEVSYEFIDTARYNENEALLLYDLQDTIGKANDIVELIAYYSQNVRQWSIEPNWRIILLNISDVFNTTLNNSVTNYGVINRSIKNWSGEYTIGNLDVEINSFPPNTFTYINTGTKVILIGKTERKWDQDIYATLFTGTIQSYEYANRVYNISIYDNMLDLANRIFTHDYAFIGGTVYEGNFGFVEKIVGTSVFFSDYTEIKQYQVTEGKGRTIWETLAYGAGYGYAGYRYGGVFGAVVGFGLGVGLNLPHKARKRTQIEIYDYDAIPEDILLSNQIFKFMPFKQATVSYTDAIQYKEYTLKSGTMYRGIQGELRFESTDNINVGDYIYIKTPIIYTGSPLDCVRNILCGTHIDIPYATDILTDSLIRGLKNYNMYDLLYVIPPNNNEKVFDVLSSLMENLNYTLIFTPGGQLDILTISPDYFERIKNVSTYINNQHTLEDYTLKVNADEQVDGYIVNYAYDNETFNKSITIGSIGSLYKVGTIELKWVDDDNLAYISAYRKYLLYSKPIKTIEIKTSLYGLPDKVGDIIRFGSQYYMINSQNINLHNCVIDFTALDLTDIYGAGYCVLSNISENNYTSGYYTYKFLSNIATMQIGTLQTSISGLDGTIYLYSTLAISMVNTFIPYVRNAYIIIGTSEILGNEIAEVIDIVPTETTYLYAVKLNRKRNVRSWDAGVKIYYYTSKLAPEDKMQFVYKLGTTSENIYNTKLITYF